MPTQSRAILRRAGLAAVPLALTLALTACGGGGDDGASTDNGGRPSIDQLSSALQGESPQLTPAAATCLAKAMEGTTVSNDLLQAIMKNDQSFKPSAADTTALKGVESQLLGCLAKVLPSGGASALSSSLP